VFKNLSKIVLITAILIFAVPHSASAVSWFPLVPCGLNQQPAGIDKSVHDYTQPCNQCLLIELGKNVIDMTFFAIVPSVGTLMFMIAGFIILFNAREGKSSGVAKGKEIMTNTAIGIAIILGAWLITNFILKSIANDQVAGTPWYEIQCKVGTLQDIVLGTVPPPAGVPPVAQKYSCNANNVCIADSTGKYATNTCDGKCPAPTGAQCLQSGLNLCQGNAPQGCANANCSQYNPAINNVITALTKDKTIGVVTANILKSFMEIESSCNINPPGGGSSYGLMQLTPPIPQIYGTRCKMSKAEVDGIGRAWLTNPANAEKSICISAQWINAVASSQCGSSIRNLYAGYNGGTGPNGACAPSASCAGEKSCSNEPMKRWECLYEDTAHTRCNGATAEKPQGDIMRGYNQTRLGATKIQYCVVNPGF